MSEKTIIIVAAVVALGLSLMGCRALLLAGGPTPNEEFQTVAVKRGDITATVNATGSIAPEAKAILSFKMPGRVAKIAVEEGERVEAGEVLAELEMEELKLAVEQAKAALAMSEAQLEQLEKGARPEDIAAAEANLGAARANLTIAKASLASARASLDKLLAGPTEHELKLAELNIENAKNALWGAQGQRDAIAGSPLAKPGEKDAAEAAVGQAHVAVQIAQVQYEQLKAGPRKEDIAIARAQVEQARGRVEGAQAQVHQAQAALDKLKAGATTEEIAIAKARVDQARAALKQAQQHLEDARLIAPFSGIVARIGADVGEMVSSATPMITLVDLSSFHIDLQIDETDIGLVKVGQEVNITLDAFPNAQLKGRVARIDPVGTVIQGIVSYGVTVEIEPTDVPIKPEMTANADIIVAEKKGVLLVPNRAIGRDSKGKYVEVLTQGQPKKIYIEAGLSDGTFTEVLEGLKEGEKVVIKTQQQRLREELRERMMRR